MTPLIVNKVFLDCFTDPVQFFFHNPYVPSRIQAISHANINRKSFCAGKIKIQICENTTRSIRWHLLDNFSFDKSPKIHKMSSKSKSWTWKVYLVKLITSRAGRSWRGWEWRGRKNWKPRKNNNRNANIFLSLAFKKLGFQISVFIPRTRWPQGVMFLLALCLCCRLNSLTSSSLLCAQARSHITLAMYSHSMAHPWG